MKASRRGHGEGTIFQRKDGIWQAALTLEGTKRQTYYGKTRRIVSDKLKAALHQQQEGSLITGPDQSVGDYLTRWLEDAARLSVRPKTLESYARQVRVHIIPELGKIPLKKLTAQHLETFYRKQLLEGNAATKESRGLAASSVGRLHAIIHRALAQAERKRLVARNVADLVDPPRFAHKEMRPLSETQVIAFLESARADRFHALYGLAVATGMRQAEMLGLAWADVDLERGTLAVRQQLVSVPGQGFSFSEPKTEKGRRSITLPPFVVAALRAHRIRQLEEKLAAGPGWNERGLVFVNEAGQPIERGNLVRRSFLPLLKAAGLPRIRFHDLRHTAATLLLSQGTHPKVVQERLGHATIAMTLDVYSHVVPSMQADAAAKLEELLGPQNTG